jgi:hypothetical protein
VTSTSFYWSEDFNESLNYWFWLRRLGKLGDDLLVDRVRHTLGLSAIDGHNEVSRETGFSEYLIFWRQWKRDQINRQTLEARTRPANTLKSHYQAVKALGGRSFTIQWVIAPFGERWVVPPTVVLLGADGGTPEERRNAVLGAAKALLEE